MSNRNKNQTKTLALLASNANVMQAVQIYREATTQKNIRN